jgi:uncharacterized protein YjiK
MKTKLFFFILLATVFASCGGDNSEETQAEVPKSRIKIIAAYKLELPEPSGIAFDKSDSTLWIVSDANSTVYKTDLSGKVISSFKVDGEDLEGVSILQHSYIAVVLERAREVLYLFKSGKLRSRKKLRIPNNFLNNGLEGISYSNKNHQFYIVNEKNPKLLMGYSDSMQELFRDTLRYAGDISGVCYDDSTEMLWLISDESSSLYLLNKERQLIGAFPLGMKQLEGVAFDPDARRLYIVSDLEETLYVYELIGEPDLSKPIEIIKRKGGSGEKIEK